VVEREWLSEERDTPSASAARRKRPRAVYDATPAGAVRRGLFDGSFAVKGDAGRSITAMIDAMDARCPPLRLALGSTAYRSIGAALAERLRALEAQKDVALAADVGGWHAVRSRRFLRADMPS
jgi:hypothetical protein